MLTPTNEQEAGTARREARRFPLAYARLTATVDLPIECRQALSQRNAHHSPVPETSID